MSELLDGAGPLRQRLFACVFSRFSRSAESYMAPYRSRLFRDLSGVVLEIGPGSGANLRYLAHDRVCWVGIEPNRFMHAYLAKEAPALGLKPDVRQGSAEQLPVPASSVDAVISTWVLCSVTSQERALQEVLRVLKPGGKFVFIEHVAAPRGSWLRRIQHWLRPFWNLIGDGCHPDREIGRAIEQAGFTEVRFERFDAPLPVVKPHIAGFAVKGA